MRDPDFEIDGWCLDDGETYHKDAPETFWLPEQRKRESLRPGDLAKLIFRISVDGETDNVAVERMWVLVREKMPGGYMGVLDNEPSAIAENEELWLGTEFPFYARNVIDIDERDTESIALALRQPRKSWPR